MNDRDSGGLINRENFQRNSKIRCEGAILGQHVFGVGTMTHNLLPRELDMRYLSLVVTLAVFPPFLIIDQEASKRPHNCA